MEASIVLILLYQQSWLETPGLMEGSVGDAEGAASGGKNREKVLEREWKTCHLPCSLLRRPRSQQRVPRHHPTFITRGDRAKSLPEQMLWSAWGQPLE